MSNIKTISVPYRPRDNGGNESHNGGHQPPEGPSMEARVAALEARLDATLPTLATKADLSQSTTSMVKWIAGTGIALASVLVSAFMALSAQLDNQDRPAAAQPAPIVIQVPAYQAPPPAAPPPASK